MSDTKDRSEMVKAMQGYLLALRHIGVSAGVFVSFSEKGFSVTWATDGTLVDEDTAAALAEFVKVQMLQAVTAGLTELQEEKAIQ